MTASFFRQFLLQLGLGGRETRIDSVSQLIRLGRDEYRFVEGDRSVLVFIEMLRGTPNRLIQLSSIEHWLPPHEDQEIGKEEQQRIADKIANFLAGQGYKVEIG